ncbi:protein GrpE [Spirochaetia bacterium]|nr:protein GrpE [Spirochaetia bacterium]
MKKNDETTEDNTEPGFSAEQKPEMPASPVKPAQDPAGQAGGNPSGKDSSANNPENVMAPGNLPENPPPGSVTLSIEEKLAALEAQLAEANDNYLRKAADFENYRKRMNQEKQSAIDYANQTLLLDLISIIDDLERAIKAAETQREAAGSDAEQIAASFNSLREGISMIEKNLVSQLENKWDLKRFDSAGEPFDPNRHEAIMMEKSAELDEPVVAEDFIKGYILKDRVIRPAKVKVVMPEK